MIRSTQSATLGGVASAPAALPSRRSRILWTVGNALMLAGLYMMLLVGGIYTDAQYNVMAARGDSDLPPIGAVVAAAPAVVSVAPAAAEADVFSPPQLNTEGQPVSRVPDATQAAHTSSVTRVAIPSIGVDSKVVEVGWDVIDQNGAQVAVWQVAEYAVGQHRGSSNPGEGDNIVLAGHVGGYGKVFKELYYVKPGDEITIYSAGQQYLYTVQERLTVQEEGVSDEQHAENARYIEPTGQEMLTLVTCWPMTGKDRFTQRVIVRALPYGTSAAPAIHDGPDQWTIR